MHQGAQDLELQSVQLSNLVGSNRTLPVEGGHLLPGGSQRLHQPPAEASGHAAPRLVWQHRDKLGEAVQVANRAESGGRQNEIEAVLGVQACHVVAPTFPIGDAEGPGLYHRHCNRKFLLSYAIPGKNIALERKEGMPQETSLD